MALIAIGVVGLIARVITSGSEELVLSGLLPISQDVAEKVTIRSPGSEEQPVELVKDATDTWRVNNQPAFIPKLNQFWSAVNDMEGNRLNARLIATNPANHERMGVADGQGTLVSFSLRVGSPLETFIIGEWRSGLCYLRRPGKTEVYGIPCPRPGVFDPDPDGWKNPVVVAIPPQAVESITFSYPEEEFVLKISDGDWVVASGEEETPADFLQLDRVLGSCRCCSPVASPTPRRKRALSSTPPTRWSGW